MEYSDHSKGRYCFLVVLFHLDRCICESLYLFALYGSQSLKSLIIENILDKGFTVSCLNAYTLIP